MQTYDYVIAGGGSAGCALAKRLAEDPTVSVCLVEAGGKGRDLFIRMPAGNGFVFGNPRLDWGYTSVPQAGLNGRPIYYPRGKALGGSSIVNGMIYMRGVAADYDAWQALGLEGWSYADVLPYFKRAEGSRDRRDAWHGVDGPLKTEPARNYGAMDEAFIRAAEKAGHQHLDDFNGAQRTGVGRNDSTVHKGVRQSAAIAYLTDPPANLTIMTHTHIAKVVVEAGRAIGVMTVQGDLIRADKEVIVCQGTFATPQLLMLSGIGPADHLRQHGIDVVVDLPSVGQHLADHPDVSMQYSSERLDLSHAKYQRLDHAVKLMGHWLLNGGGPGGGAFFSTVLFHAFDNVALPEVEVFMTPMVIEENMGNGVEEQVPWLQRLGRKLLVRGRKMARPGVQIDINLERPKSTGSVRLASTNPMQHPVIDPNYFSHPDDLEVLMKSVKVLRQVMTQAPMADLINGPIGAWATANTDAEIIEAIKATAYTGHHPACTARMGEVLDEQLRVRGVAGLRVCDASAMPRQITGNLYATVIMMAEKAADMILGRPPLPPEYPLENLHERH